MLVWAGADWAVVNVVIFRPNNRDWRLCGLVIEVVLDGSWVVMPKNLNLLDLVLEWTLGLLELGSLSSKKPLKNGCAFLFRMFETTIEMCLFLLSSNGSKPSSSRNGAEWVRGCEFVMTLAAIF